MKHNVENIFSAFLLIFHIKNGKNMKMQPKFLMTVCFIHIILINLPETFISEILFLLYTDAI